MIFGPKKAELRHSYLALAKPFTTRFSSYKFQRKRIYNEPRSLRLHKNRGKGKLIHCSPFECELQTINSTWVLFCYYFSREIFGFLFTIFYFCVLFG